MTNHPPRWLLAIYFLAIAAAWVMLSSSDYNEARKLECTNRSNKNYDVTWDSSTDTCTKEKRNGSSAQNR
jgi:hypothetical protein